MSREQYIIGVDLGGTNLSVGAMPIDGSREIGLRTLPTHAELGANAVSDRIAEMIEGVVTELKNETGAKREDVMGVGIGSPGPLDRERGVVIFTPNLGWRDYPLRDEISKRVNMRATLDNDANCATLGEFWRGAARGGRDVIGMTLGTGIGGGLVLDGRLYHGVSDAAGEIGHTSIETNGRRCKCGNYGCLEAYCSGPAIAERAREAFDGEVSPILDALIEGDLARINAHVVYEAARRGDIIAREVVRDTARFLGTGVANLINIFNPDTVVLAGGVTQAGEALMLPLQAEVKRRAFKVSVDACKIVLGSLPMSAGVVGAVATFKERVVGSL
ncbi:MAG: ROK family protein [Gemmatimonadaceae bacterium]